MTADDADKLNYSDFFTTKALKHKESQSNWFLDLGKEQDSLHTFFMH